MSINKVVISGNIGGEPVLRQTAGGNQVLSFSVAVNDRYKDEGGEWKDRPNWVGCTMFGNRAASLSRFLAKGTKVAIEGKLRWSQWETQDGGKRSKLEVVVDELEFMSRNENGSQGQAYGRGEVIQPAMETVPYDDEIPF